MQHDGNWDGTAAVLIDAALGLERAGAQGLILATNTMHKVADQLQAATTSRSSTSPTPPRHAFAPTA